MKYRQRLLVLFLLAIIFLAWKYKTDKVYQYWLTDFFLSGPPTHLLIGSSTMEFFPSEHLPDCGTWLNRGLGNSTLKRQTHYLRHAVLPDDIKQVYVYSAENDLHSNIKQVTVWADFLTMLNVLEHQFPDAAIYVLEIKLSPARQNSHAVFQKFNEQLRTFSARNAKFRLLPNDIPYSMYISDGVHFSTKGYQQISRNIKEYC